MSLLLPALLLLSAAACFVGSALSTKPGDDIQLGAAGAALVILALVAARNL